MNKTIDVSAFDRGTDPILQFLTTEKAKGIVAYRGEPSRQDRIQELAVKSNEEELSEEEKAEYAGYVRANKFVEILQTKALKLLASTKP